MVNKCTNCDRMFEARRVSDDECPDCDERRTVEAQLRWARREYDRLNADYREESLSDLMDPRW